MPLASSLIPLPAATIACDVARELCVKIDADRLPAHPGPERGDFIRGLLSDGWLLAGIAARRRAGDGRVAIAAEAA